VKSTHKGQHCPKLFSSLQECIRAGTGKYYSLRALETAGVGKVSRLPVSIRIVLESVLRNCDGKKVTEEHVRQLANWGAKGARTDEIPFVVARVVLQDFTGVPLLATWPRCATSPATWARIRSRSSRWCRSTWSSTIR
jgi:aconitase A